MPLCHYQDETACKNVILLVFVMSNAVDRSTITQLMEKETGLPRIRMRGMVLPSSAKWCRLRSAPILMYTEVIDGELYVLAREHIRWTSYCCIGERPNHLQTFLSGLNNTRSITYGTS